MPSDTSCSSTTARSRSSATTGPTSTTRSTTRWTRRLFEILAELHAARGAARGGVARRRALLLLGPRHHPARHPHRGPLRPRVHRARPPRHAAPSSLPGPILVALKGWVIGGSFERALLCDVRVAGESARMRLPEIQHGVVPDSGGTARLFQMAGHGLVADLALTGRVLTAEEALRHGIVSRVVPGREARRDGDRAWRARSPRARASRSRCSCARCGASRTRGAALARRGGGGAVAGVRVAGLREFKAARAEKREPRYRGR